MRHALIITLLLAVPLLAFDQRPQKKDDPDEPAPIPVCEQTKICAHGAGQCVADSSGIGFGCCNWPDPEGCETIPPQHIVVMIEAGMAMEKLHVFGGTVFGYRVYRHLQMNEFSEMFDSLPPDARVQLGLYVLKVEGKPRLYYSGAEKIKKGGFINDLGDYAQVRRYEYIPKRHLVPRTFE